MHTNIIKKIYKQDKMSVDQQTQERIWLNDDFLKKTIKNDLNTSEEILIRNFSSVVAVPAGENYSSQLYRVTVTFSTGDRATELQKKYIVKCMPTTETVLGELLKQINVFVREVTMYTETLPAIMDVINSADSSVQIMPRLLHWTNEPQDLLVLEDLTAQGFRVPSRRDGLDREHCEMALGRLARMHAASMVLNRKNPKFRENFNKGCFFDGMPDFLSGYYISGVKHAITLMKKLPECQKYVNSYEAYVEVMIERGIELIRKIPEDEDDFNVLNHGDFWLTNMLFKYNLQGKPIDIRFVDFQMSTFGNPGLDLNYFFFTSSNDETRAGFREALLRTYQETLTSHLVKWNHKGFVPTYENLTKKLREAKDIAIMTPCIVLPLVKLDKENSESISTEKIMDSAQSGVQLYNNHLYHEAFKTSLLYLEEIGYIEAE